MGHARLLPIVELAMGALHEEIIVGRAEHWRHGIGIRDPVW